MQIFIILGLLITIVAVGVLISLLAGQQAEKEVSSLVEQLASLSAALETRQTDQLAQ